MTNLEDKIIAYLDGTLDEQSRAELLHTLSVSPEKRKLLEEHIKLRELIALGHKPQSVPLMTERKLADRIPVLMQELPYLAEKSTRIAPVVGVSQTSYFTLLGRQVSNFFSTRFAPALSLGTLALVGGLTWYMMSPSNDANQDVASAPTASQSERALTDASKPEIASSSVTTAPPSATASSTTASSTTVSSKIASSVMRRSYTKDGITYIWHNGEYHPVPVPEAMYPQDMPDFGSVDQEHGSIGSSDEERNADKSKANVERSVANSDQLSRSSEASASESSAASSNPSASPESIRDPQLNPTPVFGERTVTGRFVIQADLGAGATMRPNPKSQEYEAGSTDVFPNIGVGYEFENGIAVGVEVGRNALSQHQQERVEMTPVGGQGPAGSPISVNRRVDYTASIVDVDAYWTQATVRYTLNPDAIIPVEINAGAGAAFVDGVSPMISLGTGVSYELSESVALVGGVTMRGAWLDGLNAEMEPTELAANGEAIGVTRSVTTEEVFSSSITGRFGVRVGL